MEGEVEHGLILSHLEDTIDPLSSPVGDKYTSHRQLLFTAGINLRGALS